MAERPRDESAMMGHFKAKFWSNDYISHQYLWTVRWGNGYTTTSPLGVFTQRNFVADFIRLILDFFQKNKKAAFLASLRGLGSWLRTPFIARWKARDRLPL